MGTAGRTDGSKKVDGNNGGHAELVGGKAEHQGSGAGFEEKAMHNKTFLSALQDRYHRCSLVDKDMGEVRKGQMTCPKS